jgi:hypothetical protein
MPEEISKTMIKRALKTLKKIVDKEENAKYSKVI